MAGDREAPSYAEVVPLPRARSFRRSRMLPLALLVPVVAFGTPAFALALLTLVLAMPIVVTTVIVLAARAERSA